MTRFRARAAVILITLAFGCTAGAAPAIASQAAAPTRGQAASGWLARQLVDGSHFVTVFDGVSYPDQGETIDAILAFAATKTANNYAARALGWLERPGVLSNYIGSGADLYAGETAKVALAAEVRGLNPERFGKTNLIKRLASLITKSGEYSDRPLSQNFSNAFSQSLAIIALSRHGIVPAKAIRFLISSECKNGSYPLDFGQSKCVGDADATAMDVQALLAVGERAAALRGVKWLAKVQRRDGGLAESAVAGEETPNANSTGLAGEAFAAAGWKRQAAGAAKFLLRLQLGCSAPSAERGAIAYDSTGFAESTAVDATAQAVLGLEDISLASLSSRGSVRAAPRLACAA
jgi:hypothetical protein